MTQGWRELPENGAESMIYFHDIYLDRNVDIKGKVIMIATPQSARAEAVVENG